jgi:hypothetical protein
VKIPTLDELGRWTDDFIGANPTEQDLYDPENTATAIFAGYSAGSNRGGPMGLYLFSKSNSGRGQIGLAAGSNLELLGAAMLGGPRRVPGCGGNSFVGDTPILMADGTSKAIKDIDVGDQVEATDPSTQTTNVEPVTQLHLNYDTDLADLMLTTTDGHQSILHTTQNHLFWDATTQQWTPTTQLQPGDTLYNVDGRSVRVTAVHEFTAPHDMYNLTVNDIHTYYVIAGDTPVLVHNEGGCAPPNLSPAGAGRRGAFNQAKRNSGIPTSQSPNRTLPNVDRRGNPQPGSIYEFDVPAPGGGTRTIRIRDDAGGHVFPDDPSQNRGPHFNTENGDHYDY